MSHHDVTSRQRRNLFIYRIALYTLVSTSIAFPALYQPLMDRIWSRLKADGLYTSSVWETILTIVSYVVLELTYTLIAMNPKEPYKRIDRRPGTAHLHKNGTVFIRKLPKRLREIAEYAGPLFLLDFTMVKKFVGVPRDEIIRSGGYTPSSNASISDGLTGLEIQPSWKVPTLHHFTWSHPLQLVRALPERAPSAREVVCGVLGALVLYDLFFYLSHLAMHKIKALWRIHVFHHKHVEIHAQVTNQLSLAERFTLVTSANLALHAVSAHPLSRTIFVPIFLYLLVENHCGLDLPYGYHKLLPDGWAAGPEDHAEHHRKGNVNFQPYLTWADRLMGTYTDGRKSRPKGTTGS